MGFVSEMPPSRGEGGALVLGAPCFGMSEPVLAELVFQVRFV